MSKPLSITILWHMHQPFYRDPIKDEYTLPWTYLHAVKDYYDMAAIVDEVPGARAVFNFVPSLLEQLQDYAAGTAADQFLRLGKMSPSDMTEAERLFLLENFFSANRQRMIEPQPRYLELLSLTEGHINSRLHDRLRSFNDQDLLDLQVCFFLAWTGEAARRRYPQFQELLRKGKNYAPEDKELLFNTHSEVLNAIIPLYKKLREEGKAELSVSPYFHPILPLLCDMKNALTAMPRANLPAARFKHPEDARNQVNRAVKSFQDVFGFTPTGMWPSEGSVSDEALEIIAECGLQWAATDEEIIAKTIGGLGDRKRDLYHPYLFKRREHAVNLFFRDHQLSDLVGFTYSQWEAERAVDDFIGRLQEIAHHGGAEVVPVILDGENAWEYYADNGYHFLTRLYEAIAETSGLQAATFSEVLLKNPSSRVLSHIYPGSWINGDYGIWVGHPEENLGWDYLERARETAVNASQEVALLLAEGDSAEVSDVARQVVKSIYAAEGSDWFWWYGDDHFSPHSDRFDKLFRRHLMNVYRLLGLDCPRELYEPIKKKTVAGLVREPAALISPTINGAVDDYFEWLAAGLYDLTRQSSAMHASESLLQSFFYGFDHHYLYFRLDGAKALDRTLSPQDELVLYLAVDYEYRLTMNFAGEQNTLFSKIAEGWKETAIGCRWKMAKVCEVQVPLDALKLVPGAKISAFVVLRRGGDEIGRWPGDAPLLLTYRGAELELETWLI